MSEVRRQTKNAVIELMRFVFASVIVLFHAGRDMWSERKIVAQIGSLQFSFFRRGYYAVEFFFLLTGLLMAHSIFRRIRQQEETFMKPQPVGEETVSFIWKKMKMILPYYLTACALMIPVYLWKGKNLKAIVRMLPSIFFLDRFGFTDEKLLSVSWYLAAMLIALAFIYPFCRKFYGTFTTLIAPLAGLVILGELFHNTGEVVSTLEWTFITYKMNFRAIAEVALGTTCFEIARRLKGMEFSAGKRILFSLLAIFCYAASLFYMAGFASKRHGWIVIFLLGTAIVITWSRIGWIGQNNILQNGFFIWLGRLSLPLYLVQNVSRAIVPGLMKNARPGIRAVSIYLVSLALAIVIRILYGLYLAGRYKDQGTLPE